MRTAITAIALAGLTSAASAQAVGTVTVTTSETTVNVGDVFTVGVLLSDNVPGPSVYSFNVLVGGSGAAFSTVPDSLLEDPEGSGYIFFLNQQLNPDGAQAGGTSWDILGPSFDAPLDDLTIFSFQVRATESGVLTFDPTYGAGTGFAIGQVASCAVTNCPIPYDEIVFESMTINVIPSPSTLGVIAMVSVASARRRR